MSPSHRVTRIVPIVVAAALCAAPAGAAALTSQSTFDFAGPCGDCTGTATAELILADYTLGSPITSANFVSFSYSGTNLLNAFTVSGADAPDLSGSMSTPLPGPEDFSITGSNGDFTSQTDGFWCAGGACYADYGLNNTWTAGTTTTPTTIPEPVSLTLLGGGLLALAASRRKT